jgi:hypothetical protein
MNKAMLVIFFFFVSLATFAQTVTVNSEGGAMYTSVQSALDAVSGDPTTPDVVNITGGGPYNEIITIASPVTLKGDSYRPILAVRSNSASLTTPPDGLVINASGEVTLENLVIIPSLTDPPGDNNSDGICIASQTPPGLTLTMTDILICPNNGSNEPVSTDGLTEVDLTGATPFGDDGMNLTSAPGVWVVANFTRVISTNNRNPGNPDNDGFYIYPTHDMAAQNSINFLEGCVASFNGGIGIGWQGDGGATININGTHENPVLIIGNKTANSAHGGCTLFNGTATVNYCIIADNDQAGFATLTAGAALGTGLNSIQNTIIANNGGPGILSADNDLSRPALVSVHNVTLFGNGTHQILNTSTRQGFSLTNTIVAGAGTTGITNDGAACSVAYSALVTGGAHALTATTGGTGTTTVAGSVINVDPEFVSLNLMSAGALNSDFLDVNAVAYQSAGVGGAPLAGGADYVGPPPLGVSAHWSLYE